MSDGRLQVYGLPDMHESVSEIIRRHSTNSEDVRELALAGRDLSGTRAALDLGCGFGFMAEALAGRLPTDALIVGVDAWPANGEPFLTRVRAAGREARFAQLDIAQCLPWPDASFDLVVSSYSLYFFPDVIAEVARVLRPGGRFLVLTHSEEQIRDLQEAAGLSAEGRLLDLVHRFSAENGTERLAASFGRVERRDYQNSLRFGPADLADLLRYLRFKVRLMVDCTEAGEQVCAWFEHGLEERVRRVLGQGEIRLSKDDSAFWAEEPRHPERPEPAGLAEPERRESAPRRFGVRA